MHMPQLFFERRCKVFRRQAASAIEHCLLGCAEPVNRWFEIRGPGVGLRLLREGSHDFFSIAELIKTLVRPGMSDLERALAVYRFSNRHTYGFSAGFGNTEMTRFLNCFGYSFCWGQGDFQHLLYEGAGLPVRAPLLKGHSSTEVLIDGKWRMLDAYMRLVAPTRELDGLATGAELSRDPGLWDAIREGEVVKRAKDYWSFHGAGGTYEPWEDSRAMFLTLRRGESLRFTYDRRESWCVAPWEPSDYCNGEWTWKPVLDAEHLERESDGFGNVGVTAGGRIGLGDPSAPGWVEYRVRSPYPLCRGSLSLAGAKGVAVSVSNDGRRTWKPIGRPRAAGAPLDLGAALSQKRLSHGEISSIAVSAGVFEIVIRLQMEGASAGFAGLALSLLVQAHGPSLPRQGDGANRWTLLSSDKGATFAAAWDEYPGLAVSDRWPIEGDEVILRATVHNRGTRAARNVAVRFTQAGTRRVLGRAVIPSIQAGSSADAVCAWRAEAIGDRPGNGISSPRCYVRTVIRAQVGPEAARGRWTGVAEAVVTVRPRPRPRFSADLTWSSDGLFAGEGRLVLRAALVHLDPPPLYLYQSDVRLSATVTPYLGEPGRGGARLGESRRLEGILPSEFTTAEWTVQAAALPKSFDAWFVVECDDMVAPGQRRLRAKRRVTLG